MTEHTVNPPFIAGLFTTSVAYGDHTVSVFRDKLEDAHAWRENTSDEYYTAVRHSPYAVDLYAPRAEKPITLKGTDYFTLMAAPEPAPEVVRKTKSAKFFSTTFDRRDPRLLRNYLLSRFLTEVIRDMDPEHLSETEVISEVCNSKRSFRIFYLPMHVKHVANAALDAVLRANKVDHTDWHFGQIFYHCNIDGLRLIREVIAASKERLEMRHDDAYDSAAQIAAAALQPVQLRNLCFALIEAIGDSFIWPEWNEGSNHKLLINSTKAVEKAEALLLNWDSHLE